MTRKEFLKETETDEIYEYFTEDESLEAVSDRVLDIVKMGGIV